MHERFTETKLRKITEELRGYKAADAQLRKTIELLRKTNVRLKKAVLVLS